MTLNIFSVLDMSCDQTLYKIWVQSQICINILYPDAVPPIHGESYHVATDKVPSIDGGTFRSIFSDNLQPIATRGKKARGTLLVDKHCRSGCSIKRAPLSVGYYNEISGGHIGSSVVRRRGSAGPVLPLWMQSNNPRRSYCDFSMFSFGIERWI